MLMIGFTMYNNDNVLRIVKKKIIKILFKFEIYLETKNIKKIFSKLSIFYNGNCNQYQLQCTTFLKLYTKSTQN